MFERNRLLSNKKLKSLLNMRGDFLYFLVSSTGIEPVSQASEARIFPLNYEDRTMFDRISKSERKTKNDVAYFFIVQEEFEDWF